MKIVPVQQCRSLEGWMPVVVASASDPSKSYVVHVNPWGHMTDNICECRGFQYRGKCRHQQDAVLEVCGWHGTEAEEVQTEVQKQEMICPRCAGTTTWTMEVEEDEEPV